MTPERFRQIEELYHAAREGTADERAALLEQTDPELRCEVESLLSRRAGGEFLDRPAIQNAPELLEDATVTEFTAGACLGPYRIESKLGEGGMGQVFRAVDTRLGRPVAIKIAHERFSSLFEREGRAISSLNHPHICTVYDVGPNYLVMELVEGETIATQLRGGALPVKTAHLYASQIAAALAEAHGNGIIHRDLKPGNIMIAKSGVKVLDFGLAKSGTDETATASHMVMGTPAYMAPEQREGKPADARTDIYSFGCILYEMLTGGRVGAQRKRIPLRRLEKVVNRCLEENPERRWQSAAGLERELGKVAAPTSRWFTEQIAKRGSKKTWMAAGAVMGAVFVACLLVWMAFERPAGRVQLRVQQLTTNSAENPVWNAVISPDGNYLAYGDLSGIQLRLIATGETHTLPKPPALASGDVWFPSAWFPDGTRILASSVHPTAQGQITSGWTVSVIGGTANRLRDNAVVYSTSPDGSLIAFTTGSDMVSLSNAINKPSKANKEIWLMEARGENARRVITGDDRTYLGSIRWSPAGNRIAYRKLRFATKTFAEYTLESRNLKGGAPSAILSNGQSYFYAGQSSDRHVADDFCWTPDGRIIYMVPEPSANYRDRNLWQIAVDSETGKARGDPRRLTSLAGFQMESLSLTADGKRLVFESGSDQSHVYVGRVLSGGKLETPRRLTLDARYNSPFDWTPDSKAVIFSSDRTGTFSIYKQALDQNLPELISTGPESTLMARVSPDGRWLIYSALSNVQFPNQSDSIRLMRVPMAGGEPQIILEAKGKDMHFNCPRRPGLLCVVEERDYETKQGTLSSLDPRDGTRRLLFRIELPAENELNWTLSPDGSRLAMTGTDPQGGIEIRSLTGQIEARIEAKGWPKMGLIDWAADGKALLVSHTGLIGSPSGPIGATLLRVDLEGHVQPLWETRGRRYTWGIASPDGKYLAIRGAAAERNAWMIENF